MFPLDPRPQLMETYQHISELSTTLTDTNTAVHPYLKSINSLLYKAVLTARAATNENLPPFDLNEPVAPGKKNETQPKFYSTCKKPGRKRKGNVLK